MNPSKNWARSGLVDELAVRLWRGLGVSGKDAQRSACPVQPQGGGRSPRRSEPPETPELFIDGPIGRSESRPSARRIASGIGLAILLGVTGCSSSSSSDRTGNTDKGSGNGGSIAAATGDTGVDAASDASSANTDGADDLLDPEFIRSNVAEVDAVARVTIGEPEIMDAMGGELTSGDSAAGESVAGDPSASCGYAFVRAKVTFLEVFKGPFKKGDVKNVAWTVECPVDLVNFFSGERVLFASRGEVTFATEWYALENSTILASASAIAVLKSEAR
jgi:hypothetical protein